MSLRTIAAHGHLQGMRHAALIAPQSLREPMTAPNQNIRQLDA
jgi:hypothetical protein